MSLQDATYTKQLHRLLADASWQKASALLMSDEGKNLAKETDLGDLPLHVLLNERFPCKRMFEAFKALLSCFPEALNTKDRYGRFPIHIMATTPRQFGFFNFLLQNYPECSSQETNDGNLPIHLAAAFFSGCGIHRSFVDRLVHMHPEGMKQENHEGNLPIHMAAQNNDHTMLCHILTKHSDAARHKNKSGRLPIHIAAAKDLPANVLVLAEVYPDGILVKESDKGRDALEIFSEKSGRSSERATVVSKLKKLVQKHAETIINAIKAENVKLKRKLARALQTLENRGEEMTQNLEELESLKDYAEKILQRAAALGKQQKAALEDNDPEGSVEAKHNQEPDIKIRSGKRPVQEDKEGEPQGEESEENDINPLQGSISSMKELLVSVNNEIETLGGTLGIFTNESVETRKLKGMINSANQDTPPEELKIMAQALMSQIELKQGSTDDLAQQMLSSLIEDPDASSRLLIGFIKVLNAKLFGTEEASVSGVNRGKKRTTSVSSQATQEPVAKLPRVSLS